MNRIELAKETLQHAIDNMVDAIVKTCVEEGQISFKESEDLATLHISESFFSGMVQVGASAFAAGLSIAINKESVQ